MTPAKHPRKTARIPREQRRRRGREITLGPDADSILAQQENASAYVERLILADSRRRKSRKNPSKQGD